MLIPRQGCAAGTLTERSHDRIHAPAGHRCDGGAALSVRGSGHGRGMHGRRSNRDMARSDGPDRRTTGMAPVVTMKQLLESGVHFGHQTRRWNPKMKRFILTERNGIYIIDLQQSLSHIDRAYDFINETVAHGGSILFVGTKKQGQEAIADQALRVGMPYVNQRW